MARICEGFALVGLETGGEGNCGVLRVRSFALPGLDCALAQAGLVSGPSLEVDGDGSERDGAGVSDQSSVAGAREAIDVLEQTEERFDGRALLDNALVRWTSAGVSGRLGWPRRMMPLAMPRVLKLSRRSLLS